MIFNETKLKCAYLIEVEPIADDRGFFARTFGEPEFAAQGLKTHFVHCNISFNHKKGTLRGMHYQIAPYQEAKLVRCTKGAIYDVIIDIRPESPTFTQWIAAELTADNRRQLYIPEGFAHGFQTLEDNTEIFYQMAEFYHPESARGIRWNDPAFGIEWPSADHRIISARDSAYEDFIP